MPARDVLPKVRMNKWRARNAGLAFGLGALAGVLGFACSGEIETNFGPPGGLTGATLPAASGAGGSTQPPGGKKDAGMTPCTYKAKPLPEAAAPPADADTEAGAAAEAGAEDAGKAPDAGVTPPAEGGSPVTVTCAASWTKDIFTYMGPAGAWQCGNAACHGPGTLQAVKIYPTRPRPTTRSRAFGSTT